jgi:hypothetical protein
MRCDLRAPGFLEHVCIFDSDFSETKKKFAIAIKGQITFLLNKKLGKPADVPVTHSRE